MPTLFARLGAVFAIVIAMAAGARAEIELPRPSEQETISFGADRSSRWNQGAYEVWLLEGNCFVQQGATKARSQSAVLWVKRGGEFGNRQNLVITYLEGNVQIDYTRAGFPYQLTDKSWLGEFFSISPINTGTLTPGPEPAQKPPVFENAVARRDPYANHAIRRTQFAEFGEAVPPGAAQPAAPAAAMRRMQVWPRSDLKLDVKWHPSPDGTEWIAVVTGGVMAQIDGVRDVGTLDISTDRLVIWTRSQQRPDLAGNDLQNPDDPLEIYMEGNIVFRQGQRVIHASRMYYDVRNHVGTVLDGDMLTPAPNFQGLVRMKADVLQQTGPNHFLGSNAFLTSSRLADPGYRLQASSVEFEDQQRPLFAPFTNEPLIDPATGQQEVAHEQIATARHNVVYIGDVPIFYWPKFASDLRDPSYFIRRAQVRNDQIFGTQAITDWDMFQLLGIEHRPVGTDWTLSVDYLSKRGLGAGTNFSYDRELNLGIPEFFDLTGKANGFLDVWGLRDTGFDQLGQGRFGIPPEERNRFRMFGHHRQFFANDWRLTGEVGWISDRNFLEQYFEREFDLLKDETTGLELRRLVDSMSYGINADVRLNPFFTQTEWLPRLDHYWLGKSLLGDRLTWFEHSSAAYANYQTASIPEDPQQAADQLMLPWEIPSKGERFITTHEIDLPFQAGVFKFVPYAMGQAADWGQDLNGDSLQRLYGQFGVRASVPLWTTYPNVENSLWNVHGLAHKVLLYGDASYADANRDVTDLPLYDYMDDDVTELYRRRFAVTDFASSFPAQFDERFYAIRTGLGGQVTNPSAEVLDDITAVRLGANQRWQTKRGPVNRRRIIDWITLDTNAVLYPNPNNDNFGQSIGLADYDFRWHVGDKVTILSGGTFDFFGSGQKVVSLGGTLARPPRAQIYGGFHSLNGPIDVQMFTSYYSYQLNPKWLASSGVVYDMKELRLVANNVTLTRIGESFLTTFNFVVDNYKHNVGVTLMIQPRFANLGLGPNVPLAGLNGLE